MRARPITILLLPVLMACAAGGCATATSLPARSLLPDDGSRPGAIERAQRTLEHVFPAAYRSTQRAIITARGKQFTCDGLLAVSPTGGHHLALVSSFGTVTDVRVTPAGQVEVLKETPLLRADWSRRFVARDLQRLFIPPDRLEPAGRLADGRLVLQTAPDAGGVTAEYIFAADGSRWEELDLAARGQTFYRASATHYLTFPGMATEVPGEFEVNAEVYRLELRLATLAREGPR
jgi:hypothetical protein